MRKNENAKRAAYAALADCKGKCAMDWYPFLAAVAAFIAVCCIGVKGTPADNRLETLATSDVAHLGAAKPFRVPVALGGDGILPLIEQAKAYVRGGGSLEKAFSRYLPDTAVSSTPTMPDFRQLRLLLRSRLGAKESRAWADRAAAELDLALMVSRLLGCEASRCLEAVSGSYKRAQMLESLRKRAFSVPKATVKLLSALPLLTLALGQLMGARPLRFLLFSPVGKVCMILGLFAYVTGLAWIGILLKKVDEADGGFFVYASRSRNVSA
jgi:tight adherence protein B